MAMTIVEIVDALRYEADIAERFGQYKRLHGLADELEAVITVAPPHAEEMRSALRVIHTWASVPGALNAKHVLDLTAKALHMGDNVKTSVGANSIPKSKKLSRF